MSPALYLLAAWTVEHWPLFVAAFLRDEMETDR